MLEISNQASNYRFFSLRTQPFAMPLLWNKYSLLDFFQENVPFIYLSLYLWYEGALRILSRLKFLVKSFLNSLLCVGKPSGYVRSHLGFLDELHLNVLFPSFLSAYIFCIADDLKIPFFFSKYRISVFHVTRNHSYCLPSNAVFCVTINVTSNNSQAKLTSPRSRFT